jgi:hypothetical protein
MMYRRVSYIPSILPCSQSTTTQSTPVRARVRDTLEPGIICQHPNDGPFPSSKATRNLLAPFIDATLNRFLLRPTEAIRNDVLIVGDDGTGP